MKRSEMEEFLKRRGIPYHHEILPKMDEAHTPWDPEDPELPDWICYGGEGRLCTEQGRWLNEHETREVMRRYRIFPELRKKAERWKDASLPTTAGLAKDILAILDGKEGE